MSFLVQATRSQISPFLSIFPQKQAVDDKNFKKILRPFFSIYSFFLLDKLQYIRVILTSQAKIHFFLEKKTRKKIRTSVFICYNVFHEP
jgi:hypothetical protein